ncbi:hypothetical protein ACQ4PT_032073 [Festuca glaucescens]
MAMAVAFLLLVLQVDVLCHRSPLGRQALNQFRHPSMEGDGASVSPIHLALLLQIKLVPPTGRARRAGAAVEAPPEGPHPSLIASFFQSANPDCISKFLWFLHVLDDHVNRSSAFGGYSNGGDGGYRGSGYNPSFENAEEYPPSQEHVQAPPPKEIDLNDLANKKNREHYTVEDKRNIYAMLLARNGEGSRLKKGVLDSVVRDGNCSRRCVQRIWKETKTGGGVNAVKNNRKLNAGRKKIRLDIEALEAIPTGERTTIRQVAGGLNMPKSTVHRRLKEKVMRRITRELKPALTEANKKARVKYSLDNLEPCSLEDNPTFKAGFNKIKRRMGVEAFNFGGQGQE